MPFIKVDTNVKLDSSAKSEVARTLGELISIIPGKSETYLMTKIEDGNYMTFGGSDDSCTMIDICQFGSENKEAYNNLTAAICEKVGPILGVGSDRIFVKYSETTNWGWNGRNF